MKFTLKNLLLLNAVFLSVFTFDLDCMNDSDSAPKLKRLDSMMKLPNYDNDEERDYFPRLSLDEYFTIAYKFFKANGKSEVEAKRRIDEIREKFEKVYEPLRRLEENFGSKIYPEFLILHFSHIFKRIESIDASLLTDKTWTEIKDWLQSNKKYIPNFKELVGDLENIMKMKTENFEFTEEKIEEIYKKIVKEHDLSVWAQIGSISNTKLFCMGPKIDDKTKRFFKEKLIKFLKSSPQNFQRVMLLYFVFNMQIYAGKGTVEVIDAVAPVDIKNKEVLDKKIAELPEDLKTLNGSNIMITTPIFRSIDISFPNLMNFAVKFAKIRSPRLCRLQEDPKVLEIGDSWDFGHVLFVYKKFRNQINRIITGKGLEKVPSNRSGLKESDINDLVEAVVGIDSMKYKELKDKGTDENELKRLASAKLFNISELNETDLKNFKNSLKEILANATGFQLILSLITADTINRISNPFYGEEIPVSVRINYIDEGCSNERRNGSECLVKIGREDMKRSDMQLPEVFFHELTHVYHDMINFSEYSSLIIFSILNNPLFDACDRFFPMLNKNKMGLSLQSINIDGVTEPEILEITEKAIEYGFGNILFKYMRKLKGNEMNIRSLFKNKEFVQTCLYLNELLLPEDGSRDLDRRWISNEEMLTMQGYVPILKNGVSYIVEDRQNAQMYKIRINEGHSINSFIEYILIKMRKCYMADYFDKETYTFHNYIKKYEAQKINPELHYFEPRPQKGKYQYINVDYLKNYKGQTVEEVFRSNGISVE